ncbi:2TM domain-containing protein [Thalassospiraceae bacterium LMO-JJ14]|nr:2TM domain-containing protein [Thalassospiraceae bacterium LMO-JJ14]
MTREQSGEGSARARKRLRGFALHLVVYLAAMIVLVPYNLMATPDDPWFVLPMVGWGSVLALHVAWVMGLLDDLLKSLFGE